SLAPSVFQGAIANHRLGGLQDRTVLVPSRNVGRARLRPTPLDVLALIRRCLHHIWPEGLQPVRPCGLLHARCAISPATIRLLRGQDPPSPAHPPVRTPPPPRATRWPTCGAPMHVVMRVWTSLKDCVDTS